MGKKIKLKIKFNQIVLSPDLKSSESIESLRTFLGDLPLIKQWSEEEKFLGTPRGFNYLDHVSLSLCTKKSDNLKSILSSWSNYNISVDNFTDTTKLFVSFDDGNVCLNGEVSIQFGIKDVIRHDFVQFSNRLQFISISFRVKNSGDLITVKKFGKDWELEAQMESAYINDESDDFIKNNPMIELISI